MYVPTGCQLIPYGLGSFIGEDYWCNSMEITLQLKLLIFLEASLALTHCMCIVVFNPFGTSHRKKIQAVGLCNGRVTTTKFSAFHCTIRHHLNVEHCLITHIQQYKRYESEKVWLSLSCTASTTGTCVHSHSVPDFFFFSHLRITQDSLTRLEFPVVIKFCCFWGDGHRMRFIIPRFLKACTCANLMKILGLI